MKFDPGSGMMIRDKPSPNAVTLAMEHANALARRTGHLGDLKTPSWGEMDARRREAAIQAAHDLIRRLNL